MFEEQKATVNLIVVIGETAGVLHQGKKARTNFFYVNFSGRNQCTELTLISPLRLFCGCPQRRMNRRK